MVDDITYRPIQSKDFKYLAKIIQDTWYGGKWDRANIPYFLSLRYLYHTLARHDFSKVALKNGEPVGLVLARGKTFPFVNKRFSLYSFWMSCKLLFSKEGREGMQGSREEQAIDDFLLEDTGNDFDGELILFIVGEDARGLGVGSSLFRQFLDYQMTIKTKEYFLFTDDACTVEFYDRKGLEQAGSYNDDGFRYYIYTGKSEKS